MTSKIKVNILADGADNSIITSDGAGNFTPASGLATGALANTPAFHAYLNSSQTISNSTFTKINFNTKLFDTNSAYDNSTNYRFTVPSGYAGKYLIHMSVRYFTSSSFAAHLYLKINGGTIISACSWTNGYYTQNSNTIIIDLSVGDYLHVETWQNSGGNQNLNGTREYTYFQGFRIIGA